MNKKMKKDTLKKTKLKKSNPAVLAMIAVLCTVFFVQGCTKVKPWQRGTLARAEMMGTPDKMEGLLQDHIYFSKEASTGGNSSGGGGCGCN